MMRVNHDLHVHSTWSDGKAHPVENLIAASNAGLSSLAMVEHVNASSLWVPLWAEEVSWYREITDVDLLSGVEAKLLDVDGTLDLPYDVSGIDMILVADHMVPSRNGLRSPVEVRASIIAGHENKFDVIHDLVGALLGAAARTRASRSALLFSCLPKIGVSEQEIPLDEINRLAEGLAAAGVAVEISERWHCPSGPRRAHPRRCRRPARRRHRQPPCRHGRRVRLRDRRDDLHRRDRVGPARRPRGVALALDLVPQPRRCRVVTPSGDRCLTNRGSTAPPSPVRVSSNARQVIRSTSSATSSACRPRNRSTRTPRCGRGSRGSCRRRSAICSPTTSSSGS